MMLLLRLMSIFASAAFVVDDIGVGCSCGIYSVVDFNVTVVVSVAVTADVVVLIYIIKLYVLTFSNH